MFSFLFAAFFTLWVRSRVSMRKARKNDSKVAKLKDPERAFDTFHKLQ